MKKRLAVTLAAVALSVVMSVPAYAGTWKYVNDQWKYQRGANKFAYNEWVKDNGNWYYLDKDGYMKTGWIDWEGKSYYCSENGDMLTNCMTPDNYLVGEDGAWIAQ